MLYACNFRNTRWLLNACYWSTTEMLFACDRRICTIVCIEIVGYQYTFQMQNRIISACGSCIRSVIQIVLNGYDKRTLNERSSYAFHTQFRVLREYLTYSLCVLLWAYHVRSSHAYHTEIRVLSGHITCLPRMPFVRFSPKYRYSSTETPV